MQKQLNKINRIRVMSKKNFSGIKVRVDSHYQVEKLPPYMCIVGTCA